MAAVIIALIVGFAIGFMIGGLMAWDSGYDAACALRLREEVLAAANATEPTYKIETKEPRKRTKAPAPKRKRRPVKK